MTGKLSKPEINLMEITDDTLEVNFWTAKKKYYREVLRKVDAETLKRIQKIPDDWEDYEEKRSNPDLKISDYDKKRLSDIKKARSWELRFESMHMFNLLVIEDTLMAYFNHRPVVNEQINEALDAINLMLEDILPFCVDFKHLMLRLAKRAASDLYYLMAYYQKFTRKNAFVFENDFGAFLQNTAMILNNYKTIQKNHNEFNSYLIIVRKYFLKSSNWQGWRIDELKLKGFLDGRSDKQDFNLPNLKKIVTMAFLYRKTMKQNYDFLKYYYNHRDGKEYRLNFICSSLQKKVDDKKIDPELYKRFLEVHEAFVELKKNFLWKGLEHFGYSTISYIDLLELIYKGCRIIEFFYLRMSRYEELNNLRGDILREIESEFYKLKPDVR